MLALSLLFGVVMMTIEGIWNGLVKLQCACTTFFPFFILEDKEFGAAAEECVFVFFACVDYGVVSVAVLDGSTGVKESRLNLRFCPAWRLWLVFSRKPPSSSSYSPSFSASDVPLVSSSSSEAGSPKALIFLAPAPNPPPPVPKVLVGAANEERPLPPNDLEEGMAAKPVPRAEPNPDPPRDPKPDVLPAPKGEVTEVWPSPIFSDPDDGGDAKLESVGPFVALPKPPALLVAVLDAPKGDFEAEAKAERPEDANADFEGGCASVSLGVDPVPFDVEAVEPNGEVEDPFANPD